MSEYENKQYFKFLVLGILAIALATPAYACEPILPFIKVIGGPLTITGSAAMLGVAVAVKAIVFAASQRDLGYLRSALYMMAGNVLTTLIGFIAAAMLGTGGELWLVGVPIVWLLCLLPSKRFRILISHPLITKRSAGSIALIMTLALVASCLLFLRGQFALNSDQLLLYWGLKLAAIYSALLVSIFLTAFWEEWVIWRLSGRPVEYRGFIQPVLKANIVVLFGVMLFAAMITIPERLQSPGFLLFDD